MFALFVHDDRYDLPCSVQIEPEPIGHGDLDWRDVSAAPGFVLGWVAYADGHFGPYVPPLAGAKAFKLRELRANCGAAILAGFPSLALGSPFTYGSTDSDQTNLAHDALDASGADTKWSASIWCADAKGAWARRDHDAKQVAQVFTDFRAMRAAAQGRLAALTERVGTAASVDIVQAIVWG